MPPASRSIAPGTAYLLLTLTAAFWAGNFVIGRAVTSGIVPPFTLAWARWAGATLFLLPFAARYLWRDWTAIRARAGYLFLLGAMGAGLFNTLQYVALQSMTAVTGAVINSAGPVLIALACWMILGERPRFLQFVGILLSLAGVLYVVARGDLTQLPSPGQSIGELLMLFGLVIWGIYTALLRFRPAIHPVSFAAAIYFVAALVNTPIMAWELTQGAPLQLSLQTALAICYVAIFPGLLAYLFFNLAVESIGGTRASAFFHLTPLFTAVLATAFLSEPWQAYHAVGFALIIAGVWLTARSA
jgi:drug/metabolite transporter (DMT)-like permease